ncbi:hypothetical protein Achl_3217 [Pseudarthrobacter chlorophenolicus A6]|uniref:Uncharacterized protein n=1 Tax=Pseudarthrobacter chlorophenolicus (strain ATCC 700700 / DSM 12829 / CIP 107037 / JCM 12360 / KCTC 9906 / NCIMB 13794 / A6) TaxID=452863 RepID=B8HFY5_PSECP|nr:hypothetical protein [Pseudarthrobacter chlorophenolicus]ACL41178.1 hypothetical protein Achl_3217 [Pseudarthrobacter chlorophenolicus A6]SDQ68709.1 hypothetical protein SAMN04489738_2263 [Pseudarthrobacter chlorophenolicus]
MTLYQPEPVEISTRMRPGEWTEASLEELVASYRTRIMDMGASLADVVTDIERNDDGSVKVAVSWAKPADNGTEEDATGDSSMNTPG